MSDKNYYEVLGVERDADAKTIKRAFLKKAQKLHPDVNKDPDAEERFKEINEAYSVLSDDRKRSNYDQYGNPDGPAGFGSDYVDVSDIFGGFGMDDILSSFFGGGGARSGRTPRTGGRDMGINLHISLAEAAAGCEKTVVYDRLAPCDDCAGTGVGENGGVKACPRCHGTGSVVSVQNTILGRMQTQATCPDCKGDGRIVDHPCETCHGQGRTPSHEIVQVRIPVGVHSGQTITVTGYGEAGVRGDRSGDLVASISVDEDDKFQRQGDDLFARVEVDALEAILGSRHVVDGILDDETVDFEIPAGCQHGQRVTVPGKGMPRQGSTARGNLFVLVDVRVPADLTPSQLDLVRSIVAERSGMTDDSVDAASSSDSRKGARGRKRRPRKGSR